jgi:hypothetical protein
MRSTDVCHPNDLRAPAPRAFPARSRHFRGGESPRSLGLRVALPGTWTFHDVLGRFGGSDQRSRYLVSTALRPGDRAWAFSSHGDVAIEPLTPLSQFFGSPSASPCFRWCCVFAVRSLVPVRDETVRTGRRMRGTAKTTVVAAP